MSDVGAGAAYGLYGTLMTLYGLLLGAAVDALGVRRSLVLSFIVGCAAKVVIATTRSRVAVLAMLYGPLPAAGARGIPVMTIGIRRCTHSENRGFAFGLFYSLMNVAALFAGVAVDAFRLGLKHGINGDGDGVLGSGMRLLVLLGACTSAAGAAVALSMREGVRVPDKPADTHGQRSVEEDGSAAAHEDCDPDTAEPLLESAASPPPPTYRELLREPALWKYLVMCVLTVNLRSVFRHVDATLPKYLIRRFGCNAPTGSIYSINPAIIILLVPLVTAGTTRIQPFDMIRAGSWVSAISPLLVTAWPSSYGGVIAFVVLLSLGEAVWSPRFYDYTMAVAPEGREGAFTALAAAPLFLATLPTGMLSGELLHRYCPAAAEAACHPGGVSDPNAVCKGGALWGIIGAVTLSSPIGITLFARWLRPTQHNATDATDASPVAISAGHAAPTDRRVDVDISPVAPRARHTAGRFDAVADTLTGGFSGLRDRWKRVVGAGSRGDGDAQGAALVLDGSDTEWDAPPDGDLRSPLLGQPTQ